MKKKKYIYINILKETKLMIKTSTTLNKMKMKEKI